MLDVERSPGMYKALHPGPSKVEMSADHTWPLEVMHWFWPPDYHDSQSLGSVEKKKNTWSENPFAYRPCIVVPSNGRFALLGDCLVPGLIIICIAQVSVCYCACRYLRYLGKVR